MPSPAPHEAASPQIIYLNKFFPLSIGHSNKKSDRGGLERSECVQGRVTWDEAEAEGGGTEGREKEGSQEVAEES